MFFAPAPLHARATVLDIALARAQATLLAAHVHLCRALVVRVADRLPAKRTIEIYSKALSLPPEDAQWLRVHTLARLAGPGLSAAALEASQQRRAHHTAAFREWLRVRIAPLGDVELQQRLERELAHARAVILRVHIRNAARFARKLNHILPRHGGLVVYLERMNVDDELRAAVFILAADYLDGSSTRLLERGRATGRELRPGAHDSAPR